MTHTQNEKLQRIFATVMRNLLKVLWIFPVKNNQVMFISYAGKQLSCNPKYISMYLGEKHEGEFERIFVLREPSEWSSCGERIVRFASLNYPIKFCTSKVIVSNGGMPTYLPLRKNQYLINTWHGGGAYKANRTGGNFETSEKTKTRLALDLYKSERTNLVLSSSNLFSNLVLPEIVPQYTGEIMQCGMPRNDILFHGKTESLKDKICGKFQINRSQKLVLYAPTFRGMLDSFTTQSQGQFEIKLDFQSVLAAVRKRYNCDATLLVRAHHAMNMAPHEESANIIDVSDYPDTQELLCATDILISDYSSIIWDFSLTKRPCFLYVPDMDYYLNEDRGTYTPIETWPGILCKTNEELQDAIRNFDEQAYVKKIEKYHEDMGSYETGTACEQVCKRIAEVCGVE